MISDAFHPLLTIPEVAEILGVSAVGAYQMAAAGEIPSVRLSPRRIRVPRAALDLWLAGQAQRALANVKAGSR